MLGGITRPQVRPDTGGVRLQRLLLRRSGDVAARAVGRNNCVAGVFLAGVVLLKSKLIEDVVEHALKRCFLRAFRAPDTLND